MAYLGPSFFSDQYHFGVFWSMSQDDLELERVIFLNLGLQEDDGVIV